MLFRSFPICSSSEAFERELRRHRLDGISVEARAAIERLQPYRGGDNPLRLLNQLHNIDKHRALTLAAVVASDVHLIWKNRGEVIFESYIGADELRHGAVLGGISKRMLPDWAEVKVQGEAALFVAFEEAATDPAADLEAFRVDRVLDEFLEFFRHSVIPTLEPFFD